jgi:hypothetical protein
MKCRRIAQQSPIAMSTPTTTMLRHGFFFVKIHLKVVCGYIQSLMLLLCLMSNDHHPYLHHRHHHRNPTQHISTTEKKNVNFTNNNIPKPLPLPIDLIRPTPVLYRVLRPLQPFDRSTTFQHTRFQKHDNLLFFTIAFRCRRRRFIN